MEKSRNNFVVFAIYLKSLKRYLPRATGQMARLARQKRRSVVQSAERRQLNSDQVSLGRRVTTCYLQGIDVYDVSSPRAK